MNAVSPGTIISLPLPTTRSTGEPAAGEAPVGEIERLYEDLGQVSGASNPRTARLLASSLRKKSQKVVEEAAEVALEAVRKRGDAVVRESADLIYHLVVLWHELGIEPDQIWTEMRQRAQTIGIAEKLPKSRPRVSAAR